MEETTLADALLDDLDDLSDVEDTKDQENSVEEAEGTNRPSKPSSSEDASLAAPDKDGQPLFSSSRFLQNSMLQKHVETIRSRLNDSSSYNKKELSAESRKELEAQDHHLVVQSNKHLASLADELARAHGDLAAAYKPKFPELEELVPNSVQYKNSIRAIWNETDLTKVNALNEILNPKQLITITVAASTTSGRTLTATELQQVDRAATYMEQLLEVQRELVQFVENSMEGLAPSVSLLLGPSTAARLLGLAGGLRELTKIPSCNLQVMGQVKQNSSSQAGLSNSSVKRHVGILSDCDLVQSCPRHLQKKALKSVAAKLALAARYDFVNVDTGRPRNALVGRKFRQELQEKFEKLQEPDKAPVLKALPKPDLDVKKRRGGRRIRRRKERFEETAMMKQANTRAFSSQQGEYGDDAMGITMGLLDTADSGGAIRKISEKRKMRQANTKASRKRAMQMAQQVSNSNNASGLASSVVFSQTSSMELVNPDANKDRVREANRKWFSENAGFQSALPK